MPQFYAGQTDYIDRLNELATVADIGGIVANVAAADADAAAALANRILTDTNVISATNQVALATVQAGIATTAKNTAVAQANLAAASAISASSVLQQDLSAIGLGLHRSPNVITSMFIYDTSKDSDGGAWVERVGHTSWMNEPLCGTWLTGGFASELSARGDNLLSFPEEMAVWNRIGTPTVTSNVALAPDGTISMDALVEDTATATRYISQGVTLLVGITYVATVYAKQGVGTRFFGMNIAGGAPGAVFDLVAGTVVGTQASTATNVLASIASVGNGVFLCTLRFTSGIVSGSSIRLSMTNTAASTSVAYLGDGTSSIYLWGAKFISVGTLSSTYSASPELISNGTFDVDTIGWTAGSSTLSIVSGRLRVTQTAIGALASQIVPTVVGKVYCLSVDFVTDGITGSTFLNCNGLTVNMGSFLATYTLKFVATSTATFLSIAGSSSGLTNEFFEIDNVSVKEITTIATPYVPYSTQVGSYYQLTTDGKFYKLGAGYGATEVFRGNKAKFPRLSAIVAEANSVTIYDLTQPGCPLWMRFKTIGTSAQAAIFSGNISSVAAVNGLMCVGASNVSLGLFVQINFAKDTTVSNNGTTTGYNIQAVSLRNSIAALVATLNYFPAAIASRDVNAVAMTVLPDAPIDAATGLQVPTIAVATAGGVSVIKHDGTVANCSSVTETKGCAIKGSILYLTPRFAVTQMNRFVNLINLVNNWTAIDSMPGKFYLSAGGAGEDISIVPGNGIVFSKLPTGAPGMGLQVINRTLPTASLRGYVTPVYNTGYMVGDIRRGYLASTEVETIGPITDLATAVYVTASTRDNTLTSITSTSFSCVGGTTLSGACLNLTTIIGKAYQFTSTVSGITAGTVGMYATTLPGLLGTQISTFLAMTNGVTGTLQFIATTTTCSIGWADVALSSSFNVSNISIKEVTPDRSYKAAVASILGTLVKSAVGIGSQLVAYSGFSAANYISEAYSADLDYGIGDFRYSAWVNLPATTPVPGNYPYISAELIPNGDFNSGATNWVVAGTDATHIVTFSGTTMRFQSDTLAPQLAVSRLSSELVLGKLYEVTVVTSAWVSGALKSDQLIDPKSGLVVSFGLAVGTHKFIAVCATGTFLGITRNSPNVDVTLDSISIREVGPAIIVDRSAATGPYFKFGIDGNAKLVATVYDGTTTRTVTTTASYNNGTFIKAAVNYSAGKLYITINGVEVANTIGTPLLTLNNSTAVLTIGNSRTLDAPFPGSMALLKSGATVPTIEQGLWMYEQEKQMFRDGAQITLPSSTSVLDLTYDESQDTWVAAQAGNESSFMGLIRTSIGTPSAGSFSKVSATNGVKLLSRITTSPGVDITIPAYGLREELIRKAEAAARLSNNIIELEFTASAAQTDFVLRNGYTCKSAYVNGVLKRKTTDYTILFDGFVETVRFTSSISLNTLVTIMAIQNK